MIKSGGIIIIYSIIKLLFGIALFLFGMNLMSEHLIKIAGNQSEILFSKLDYSPVKGAAMGVGVTSLIQSSSASCAMVLSLVESDILNNYSAIPIIIGSILGTSTTGWIIAYSSIDFSSAFYISAFFAFIGIILKLFLKRRNVKRTGEILLGFSILMLGIDTISQAVMPFKESIAFQEYITKQDNILLLAFVGILLSIILQSASASVGILQSLSVLGILNIHRIVPLVFGIGIGASFPVLLSAIGKKPKTKQCAVCYLTVNTAAAVFIGTLYYLLLYIFKFNDNTLYLNSYQIAAINTAYRLLVLVLFLPFYRQIGMLSKRMVKEHNKRIMKKKAVL